MTAPQPPQQSPHGGYIPPQPPPAPPKKRHTGRNILLGVGAFFVIVIALAVSSNPGPPAVTHATMPPGVDPGTPAAAAPPAVTTQAAPATRHVVYKIGGTAKSASVTYNSDGSTSIQQDNGAAVPWTKELDVPADQALSIFQVSAQNGGSGTITCSITVDGKEIKTGTGNGAYAIASCDASIS